MIPCKPNEVVCCCGYRPLEHLPVPGVHLDQHLDNLISHFCILSSIMSAGEMEGQHSFALNHSQNENSFVCVGNVTGSPEHVSIHTLFVGIRPFRLDLILVFSLLN
jgi:hypothetical protein